jgi:signal transduction histidine kinase
MRHNSVREVGLGAALGELLARFRERQGHTVHWQADPAAAALADERAETVFRIAEEALHNIERHAQARTVTVRLQATGAGAGPAAGVADAPGTEAAERIVLSLADDGVGFDPAAPRTGHYGLRGMQEQAALIGARLRIDSQPGAGTTLTLDFPV